MLDGRMTPGKLNEKVVVERSDWVREMLERIRALPLRSLEEFTADKVTVDAAESCLRRSLEALLDLGRHVLAKGFGDAPVEYRRELYDTCSGKLSDIEQVLGALHRWIGDHPEQVERTL